MDLKLKPFDFAQAAARAGLAVNGQPLAKPKAVGGASFGDAMAQAMKGAMELSRLKSAQKGVGAIALK